MDYDFFDTDSYFIDEKVNFFKFENSYQIYNDMGQNIGSIKQKISAGQKLLRILLNKGMLPFLLEIKDEHEVLQASIARGWTFFMSRITINNGEGELIGTIKQKFQFFKPTFRIFNASDIQIAEISGDWKAWNFSIKNDNNIEIGTITKKWAGAMKEIFTSADKYNVNLNVNDLDKNSKIAIISSAITIDMVLKESKN